MELSSDLTAQNNRRPQQRVSVACRTCRARRTRCDGHQPICATCQRLGIDCEYPVHEDRRKPPSRRYTEALQAQIRSQQALIDQLHGKIGKLIAALPPGSSVLEGTEFGSVGRNDGTSEPRGNAELGDGTEELYQDKSPDEVVSAREPHGGVAQDTGTSDDGRGPIFEDVADLVGRLNLGDDGELRYFGSPSNFTLLHGPTNGACVPTSPDAISKAISAPHMLYQEGFIPLGLQLHLLDLFWTWQNTWQYVVHKRAFMSEFDAGTRGRYCTPLLLLAILSLSSRYSDWPEARTDPQDPNTAGEAFANQAKELLFREIETPTVPTVQAAVLLALREYAVNAETSAWVYIGMAVRMAHTLGLNVDCSSWVTSGQISPLEEEVRRVAWWGCFLVDKLCNVGLGRPSSTKEQDITTPRPHRTTEIEFCTWSPSRIEACEELQAAARIGSTSHAACELFCVVSPTLETIYAPNSGLSKQDKVNLVVKTDAALSTFFNALPTFLRLPSSSRKPALPHVYTLHLQYHVCVILLHRPFISRRISRGPSTATSTSHLALCRTSAAAIADIFKAYRMHYTLASTLFIAMKIHGRSLTNSSQRCIPISTVHCVFTAAVTHLLDMATLDSSARRDAARRFHICACSLRDMRVLWAWSNRALEALQLIVQEWMGQLPPGCPSLVELRAVCQFFKTLNEPQNSHHMGDVESDPIPNGGESFNLSTYDDFSSLPLFDDPAIATQSMASGSEIIPGELDLSFLDNVSFDDYLRPPDFMLG